MKTILRPITRFCITWLLIIASSVALLELTLRTVSGIADVYRGLGHFPDVARVHYEAVFLQKHTEKPPQPGNHDPNLGWDLDINGDRIRGNRHYLPMPAENVLRFVAIGDSFTYGTDVKTNESYPAQLERRIQGAEVINMGVPGYGVDQATLKYLEHGRQLNPHIVILGIFPEDYERTSLPFFAYAKPYFRKGADGNYHLLNHPVPAPAAELQRIRAELDGRSLSFSLLRNLGLRISSRFVTGESELKKTDGIIRHVLHMLSQDLESSDTQLLIVQIPPASEFNGTSSGWTRTTARHLLSVYRNLGLDFIDLATAFRTQAADSNIHRRYYVQREDGSRGHLSPTGNAATASIIANHLSRPGANGIALSVSSVD